MSLTAPGQHSRKRGPALILSRPFIVGTLMLWIAYFMGLVIFYGLINWLPLLLKDTGLSAQSATLISALFPLGGIGAIFAGWLMDRYNATLIVALTYFLTASRRLSHRPDHRGDADPCCLRRWCHHEYRANLFARDSRAAFYPTRGRASGVSWMLGMGRFGGIAGSFLVAELARAQLALPDIFLVVATPALLAAAALVVKQFVHPHVKAPSVARDLAAH